MILWAYQRWLFGERRRQNWPFATVPERLQQCYRAAWMTTAARAYEVLPRPLLNQGS